MARYNPHSLERALIEAEREARRYDHPVAICKTRQPNGTHQFWPWPYQAAYAVFADQITAVALPGSHPGAKEKARRNDEAARATFSDWNAIH